LGSPGVPVGPERELIGPAPGRRFYAKERVHYDLNNVRIEPGRLIATDGRILVTRDVAMEEGEEPFEPFLLDAKALKAAASKGAFVRPGENGTVKIRAATQKNGTLAPNGMETTLNREDCSYPEYGRVIPSDTRKGHRTALLDPANLIRIIKAFKGCESVRISILAEDEAIRLDGELPDDRKVVGVLMPLVQS
jgi:DNA polymerase III sliding clamp (beta) subunit (PCNA family)